MKKHSERFNNAINALVKGYFNDTLGKGSCVACAVGNIVAYCNNLTIIKKKCTTFLSGLEYTNLKVNTDFEMDNWYSLLSQYRIGGSTNTIVEKTGYTLNEISKIECAFEEATKISFVNYDDYSKETVSEDQFNGLMAVVEVLCKLDNIVEVQEIKEMFVKA